MGKIISNGIEYSGIQGTTVIPNPKGSPTDELSSIQIGNDIYEIVGGGSGSTEKCLQMKTKTYTGDGTTPLVVTFDEVPKCIYSIYGNGLNGTKVRAVPFVYGEETFTSWFLENVSGSTSRGTLYNWAVYSNNNKTVTITSSAIDAGAHWNISGEEYTITYFIEVNSGGSSASWTDITGTLTAGQTSISFTDSSILESSTFDFYTSKFGVNPTDIELVNSLYNFTEFMDGKIIVREKLSDPTDKKLFIKGLTKDSNAISITDTDLLAYLSDIQSGYLKACSSYDTASSDTQTGIFAIGNVGNDVVINTYIIGWTEYKSGTFYGVIDLNKAPVAASDTPQYQQNTYSDPYDVEGGYSVTLTFDEQSTDLGVKVRVTNETN